MHVRKIFVFLTIRMMHIAAILLIKRYHFIFCIAEIRFKKTFANFLLPLYIMWIHGKNKQAVAI